MFGHLSYFRLISNNNFVPLTKTKDEVDWNSIGEMIVLRLNTMKIKEHKPLLNKIWFLIPAERELGALELLTRFKKNEALDPCGS